MMMIQVISRANVTRNNILRTSTITGTFTSLPSWPHYSWPISAVFVQPFTTNTTTIPSSPLCKEDDSQALPSPPQPVSSVLLAQHPLLHLLLSPNSNPIPLVSQMFPVLKIDS